MTLTLWFEVDILRVLFLSQLRHSKVLLVDINIVQHVGILVAA